MGMGTPIRQTPPWVARSSLPSTFLLSTIMQAAHRSGPWRLRMSASAPYCVPLGMSASRHKVEVQKSLGVPLLTQIVYSAISATTRKLLRK